jgi:hypothetical protein
MRDQSKAYLLTTLVITFWATAASAFKIALQYVQPYTLLLYSTLFSCLSLYLILLCQDFEESVRAIETLGPLFQKGILREHLNKALLRQERLLATS